MFEIYPQHRSSFQIQTKLKTEKPWNKHLTKKTRPILAKDEESTWHVDLVPLWFLQEWEIYPKHRYRFHLQTIPNSSKQKNRSTRILTLSPSFIHHNYTEFTIYPFKIHMFWRCYKGPCERWLVDGTLQNFIYKHFVDLENVQRNKDTHRVDEMCAYESKDICN